MRSTAWLALVALVGSVLVGMAAYNVGLSNGAAQAALTQSAAQTGTAAVALPPYAYAWGWHRPWGFGGFPFFFFFFIFLWVVLFSWRGPWRRRPWSDGIPPSFEEWHRRAHERMGQETIPRG